MKTNTSKGRLLAVLALMIAANFAFITTAKADDDRRGRGRDGERREEMFRDQEWRGHQERARHWHRGHPVPVPGVVYAPPMVYSPPPPPPGISLIIPLDFR